ncbi:hypothetical protein AWC25_11590 [Mycobacterium sherrisii]|uniref:Glycosyl transferase family 28 C-terminal domain-containing protein n=1 Tax=Mycobacterium sherrisii TaxID=243061 RepID=A0A1E3SCG2_9MYCO|nr:hypothetical protein BHQ21_24945 [Mycobacterium sherrisii]ORW76787.1 hypothetical protein AWC25_11590 [Mycobacterium sherrisii]
MNLPRDDRSERVCHPTAHGGLHWAPHHDAGYGARMDAVARWVAAEQPRAFVSDVSVELALFVRLLGVPVIVMALPGNRTDGPHELVHRIADHIVAAWPREVDEPSWLRPHAAKTSYVGGISRFEGRDRAAIRSDQQLRVLVLGGADGDFDGASAGAPRCAGTTWTVLGGTSGWVADPWPQICAADLVVTHAGQSCIADIAAAGRPAVVIPQPRPFDEQHATATALQRHRLATVLPGWPDDREWPDVLLRALSSESRDWQRWQVQGAAARAARAIETTAAHHATLAAV